MADKNQLFEQQYTILDKLFRDALYQARPERLVSNLVSVHQSVMAIGDQEYTIGREEGIYVIGSGKAAVLMAEGLESILGSAIKDGIIIAPEEKNKLNHIQVFKGNHPTPGPESVASTLGLIDFVNALPPSSIVINLVSGGTSALLCAPPAGITVEEMQQFYKVILESGANIHEMNVIRKQVSQVKGGRLLARLKDMQLIDIMISDVPGDDPADIGSGPTITDPSQSKNAIKLLKSYDVWEKVPASVQTYLLKEEGDKTKPGADSDSLCKQQIVLAGTSQKFAEIVGELARKKGYNAHIEDKSYSGKTREIAVTQSRKAMTVLKNNTPVAKPGVVVFHGESYLQVTGQGKGGRNQELALIAAMSIEGQHKISMLSAGTDGIDGPTDAAGAIVNSDTASVARKQKLDLEIYLKNNDSYHAFERLGCLVKTGYTGQNLMDIQIWLIEA